MKKLWIFSLLFWLSLPLIAQKRLDIGAVTGIKYDKPFYEDTGGQTIQRQSFRLILGVQGAFQFKPKWAWEFGINTHNVGVDNGYSRFQTLNLNQGVTMIQIPNRLRYQLLNLRIFKKARLSLEPVVGFSYLHTWDRGLQFTGSGFTSDGSFTDKIAFYILKQNIFLLEGGYRVNFRVGKFNFFYSRIWQNAFTPIAEFRGEYTIDSKTDYYTITSHGRARNFLVGMQYSFKLNDKEERAIRYENRKFRRENHLAIPDSLRNLTQFSKRAKWALVVSSQAYLARNTSQPDSMRMRVGTAPGLVVGFDYSHQFNARWALAVGLRAGVQHYTYRYDIPARSAGLPQDFRNSSSVATAIAQIPLSINYRYAISARKFYNFGVGMYATFNPFPEEAVFVRPIDAVNPVVAVSFDYRRTPNPNISPYLSVGYGKMLAKGNVLKWDLIYNAGLVKTFAGSYQIRQFDTNQLVGQGTFFGRDSFVGIQMSYIFNSLRRQIRKDLL
jgi:hypothetical protein